MKKTIEEDYGFTMLVQRQHITIVPQGNVENPTRGDARPEVFCDIDSW
jgi:hypothetical protein